MISAACPSCGATVRFTHAQSAAAVCASCRTTCVRDADTVRDAGVVSAFERELSPLQIGTRGQHEGRGFRLIGVIRRGRPGVRWNEWYVAFDDGTTGFLGEGNGEYALYGRSPHDPPAKIACVPATRVQIGPATWWVMEVGEASVLQADGELPAGVAEGDTSSYADLREAGGKRAATIDFGEEPRALWAGPVVRLKDLRLEDARPITGWSDPDVKIARAGHDVADVRRLACPSCSGGLELKGDPRSVACRFCGSILDLDDDPAGPIAGRQSANIKAFERAIPIPLGTRGRLDGVEWEIIGAQERAVESYGETYPWIEHFLYNPWHGYRWLIQDSRTLHWNLAERMQDLPLARGKNALHDGHVYQRFQIGRAVTRYAVGEFTWQVRAGDTADTADFVDPPWMLSTEHTGSEVVASICRYVPPREISAAFPGVATFQRPVGVAPNEPNLWDLRLSAILTGVVAVAAVIVGGCILGAQLALEPRSSLPGSMWTTGSLNPSETFTTSFDVPPTARSLAVDVTSDLDASQALVWVSAIDPSGKVFHVDIGGRTKGSGWVGRPAAGRWALNVEVARESAILQTNRHVTVTPVLDRAWKWPGILLMAGGLLTLAVWGIGRARFEHQRWVNADV